MQRVSDLTVMLQKLRKYLFSDSSGVAEALPAGLPSQASRDDRRDAIVALEMSLLHLALPDGFDLVLVEVVKVDQVEAALQT